MFLILNRKRFKWVSVNEGPELPYIVAFTNGVGSLFEEMGNIHRRKKLQK